MSDSQYLAEFIVEGMVMLIVGAVGVILNIISVFYFAKLKHQRTFHHLLLILAVVDTVHLVSSSITFSIPFLSESFSNNLWKYLVPYTLALAQTSMTASVYMTLSLTIERYFSVVCPFMHFRKKWMKSTFLLSFPSLLFSLVFTLPNYFQMRTVLEEDLTLIDEKSDFWLEHGGQPDMDWVDQLNENKTMVILNDEKNLTLHYHNNSYIFGVSSSSSFHLKIINTSYYKVGDPLFIPGIAFASFRENPLYIKVYVMWLNLLFNTILPLTLLLFLNTAIYRRLNMISQESHDPHETRDLHNTHNHKQPYLRRSTGMKVRKREQRLAQISLLIVLVFFICHSVKNIPTIFEIFGKDPREVPVCSQIVLVGHLLLTINSSVNFLIYSLGNFRNILKNLPRLLSQRRGSDPVSSETVIRQSLTGRGDSWRKETV